MTRALTGVLTGVALALSMTHAFAAPPSGAVHGGGPPLPDLCPTPSAGECLSRAYQNGFCFATTKASCAAVYEAEYAKQYASAPAPLEPRVVPEQGISRRAPGSITPTKVLPYVPASDDVVAGAPGTYASFMYNLRYGNRTKGGIPITVPLNGATTDLLGALAPSSYLGTITTAPTDTILFPTTGPTYTVIRGRGAHRPIVIADLRSQWDTNGNRIASCEEYAYERFYTFSKFEDTIATEDYRFGVGHDFRQIFLALVAATPGGAVYPRKGIRTNIWEKDPDGPRNAFFARDLTALMPINFYERLRQATPYADPAFTNVEFPFDADIVARVKTGLVAPGWDWTTHSTRGPMFFASTLDDQFQRFDALKESYKAALHQHDQLRGQIAACFLGSGLHDSSAPVPPRAWCDDLVHYAGGSSSPWVGPGPLEAAHAAALQWNVIIAEATIESTLEEARAAGCLDNTGTPQPCDWSPRDIVNKVLTVLRTAEEESYDKCLRFTHGDLTSPDSILTHLRTAPPPGFASYAPPADPTASTDDFDAMYVAFSRWAADLGYDRDPTTGKMIVGQTAGDKSTTSSGDFGVALEFGVGWNVDNFSPETSIYLSESPPRPSRGLCDAEAHAHGHAVLSATILGHTQELFSANASVDTRNVEGFAAADVNVLGVPFYNPRESGDLTVAIAFEKSSTSKLFEARGIVPVMGVPVTLKAGATGTVGVKGSLTGPGEGHSAIVRDCTSPKQSITLQVKGTFEPYASVDGYASASIDLGFVEGGIKGELQLARLGLPLEVNVGVGIFGAQQGGDKVPATTADIELFVRTALDLDFSTMDGRIAMFLDTPFSSTESTIASWKGLHYRHNVFARESHVPLSFLPVIVKL